MEGSPQNTPGFDRLKTLIEEIKVGMLTTMDGGALRSRPLETVGVDEDGTLWFFTSATSAKVLEADADSGRVSLSYANPAKQDYVSVSGRATLVRDREKMAALYTKWIEVFFPKGLDDPDLGLLRVEVERAEYWDAPGSSVGRLFALAKGLVKHDASAVGENAKVTR